MTAPDSADRRPAAAAAARQGVGQAGKKVVESEGIAHISATFNNVLITITDMQGNALAWGIGRQGRLQGLEEVHARSPPPWPPRTAAREAMNLGVRRVHVRVQGPGSGRESAIQALASVGLRVVSIRDVTPIPHNGCRPPKKRRV